MRFLIILLFILCLNSFYSQSWQRLPDFPATRRDDGVAVVVGDKAYFGTGLIEWALTIDFHELDLNTYNWSAIPTMPHTTERQYACAFAGPNCFYVFGGDGVGGALTNLYKFDIASSTWTPVASKPGNGLVGASCMNFGDKVIISGGKYGNGKASNEVWEYTISSDAWQQKNNTPFPGRWRSGATVTNNTGYLIFGRDTGGAFRKELYSYDHGNDNWTKIADFPGKARAYAAMHAANNKLFVFGGIDTLDHLYKDLWFYHLNTNTWTQGPDIPAIGRKGGMSCTRGEDFFYSCGIGEGPVRITETWKTDIPVGLKEEDQSAFSMYPNPTEGLVNIDLGGLTYPELSCTCADVYGRQLGQFSLENSTALDLRGLAPGIYAVHFYAGNRLLGTRRVVKR